MSDNTKEFIVTDGHIKLIREMHWEWNEDYSGAPMVDSIRPYGNRNIFPDINRIIGTNFESDEYEEFTDEQEEYLLRVHTETKYALEIFLSTGKMKPGMYRVVSKPYAKRVWERVQKTKPKISPSPLRKDRESDWR